MIQSNRQSVYLSNADIVVNGHTHDGWVMGFPRIGLNNKGNIVRDIMYHIRTAGYKNDYQDGATGWTVRKGMAPKPMGCVWLRFFVDWDGKTRKVMMECTPELA